MLLGLLCVSTHRGAGQNILCIVGNVKQKAKHNSLVQAALSALPELVRVALVVSCHVFYAVSESGRKGKKSHRGGSPSEAKFRRKMIVSVKVCI